MEMFRCFVEVMHVTQQYVYIKAETEGEAMSLAHNKSNWIEVENPEDTTEIQVLDVDKIDSEGNLVLLDNVAMH